MAVGKRMVSYADAWEELMNGVRNGASWSGRERNCCFLNVRGKRFENVSHLSGINFHDDGRAIAICDWDRDGDQDLWLRNRTSPRLRLMINESSGERAVLIRLEGVECNRDAIGAVVQLQRQSSSIIRSVRAGEMFLSQSSKWLHFGIGESDVVGDFTVYWPGGIAEIFHGAEAGGRYLLRQGDGFAREVLEPGPAELEPKSFSTFESQRPSGGIFLPVAVPLPQVSFRDPAAKKRLLPVNDEATLLLLWGSSSGDCLRGLTDLEKARGKFKEAGISVLALAVNDIESAGQAYEAIENCGFGGSWGFIEQDSLTAILRWQAVLFNRNPKNEVPLGLLLNAKGQCVAIYRGRIIVDEVLDDAVRLIGIDRLTRWHLAPPLQGTWFTSPVDDRYVRNIVRAAYVNDKQ
jgi:hypothetical protein